MRGWLIDQKPTTLAELARLADQYRAIHQADLFKKPPQNPKSGQVPPNREIASHKKVRSGSQQLVVSRLGVMRNQTPLIKLSPNLLCLGDPFIVTTVKSLDI